MSIDLIQGRLSAKRYATTEEETLALREITQEIALAALSRTDFFKKAAFQGGTCLRIFHGLERFSEDLDFALLEENPHFQFEPYLSTLRTEFAAYGYTIQLDDRSRAEAPVKLAFLKDQSIGKILTFSYRKPRDIAVPIRIKLEVDTRPPAGAQTESRFADFPFAFAVTLHTLPSLFAGKSHALLCREFVKGRDWFDFGWYVARRTPIRFELLAAALNQQGPWKGRGITVDAAWYFAEMEKKIRSIDWEAAKADTRRFLAHTQQQSLDVWGVDFFLDCLQKLRAVI
jgi:hypothetical protein